MKAWINEVVSRIKAHYKNLSPNSQAAKVLADSMDSLTELQEMFATAARKTGERTKAAPRGDAKAETSAQTKTDGNENATDTNDGRTEGEVGEKMSVESKEERITVNMSESERARILRKKTIDPVTVSIDESFDVNLEDLKKNRKR